MQFTTEKDAVAPGQHYLSFLPRSYLPKAIDRYLTRYSMESGSDLVRVGLSRLSGERDFWWKEAPEPQRCSWGEFLDKGIFCFGDAMPSYFPKDSKKATLVAATVTYLLHEGLPFKCIADNIGRFIFDDTCQSAVCALKSDSKLEELQRILDQYQDRRRLADALFHIPEKVLSLANSQKSHQEAEIQAALFSGLLSFLLDRRALIIRIDERFELAERQRLKSLSALEKPILSSACKHFGIAELANPNPEHVALAHQAATACKIFIEEGLIPGPQPGECCLHPAVVPTQEERIRAVALFYAHLEKLLVEPFQTMQQGLENLHPKGFPGHDLRHILYVAPLTALKLAESFQDPYISTWGVFCTLLHDVGRIIEPVWPYASDARGQIGKAHALISSSFAAHILETIPDLPESVRFEVLATIARHDHGDLCDSKLAQFTQSVDRLQLIGPESIVRNMGYYAGPQNLPIYPQNAQDERSLLYTIHRYLHRLYPNLLGAYAKLEGELMVETYAFLRIAMERTDLEFGAFGQHGFSSYQHPEIARNVSARGLAKARAAYRKFNTQHTINGPLNKEILNLPLLASLDFDPGDGTNAADNLSKRLNEAASRKSFRLAMTYISEAAWNREKSYQRYLSTLETSPDKVKATLGPLIASLLNSSL